MSIFMICFLELLMFVLLLFVEFLVKLFFYSLWIIMEYRIVMRIKGNVQSIMNILMVKNLLKLIGICCQLGQQKYCLFFGIVCLMVYILRWSFMVLMVIIQIIINEIFEVLRLRQVFYIKIIDINLFIVMMIRVMIDVVMDVVREKWIVLQRIRLMILLNYLSFMKR